MHLNATNAAQQRLIVSAREEREAHGDLFPSFSPFPREFSSKASPSPKRSRTNGPVGCVEVSTG